MKKARVVGSICAVLALSWVACGGSDEPAPNAAPEPGAAAPAPEPEIPAEIVRGELPKEYPADLPMYPGATPTTSLLAGGTGLIVLSATAPAADVLAHYRNELPSQGWTVDEVTEDPASISAHKGGRTARISISPSDEGSTEIGVAIEGS
jgi:hypothetical protein